MRASRGMHAGDSFIILISVLCMREGKNTYYMATPFVYNIQETEK